MFKRKEAVEAVKVHGVNKQVALANLKSLCPWAYENKLHGTQEPVTMRVFEQWMREYDEHTN